MIDLSTRPELARLNDLITVVLNHTNDDTGLNVLLSDYPVVWDALFGSVEPEDEDELARQASRAYEEIIRDYAARIPIQWDEDGYVDETQAWELADRIYSAVSDYDDLQMMADKRHYPRLAAIADWILEGDWREDQVPNVDALVAEWREYAGAA